MIAGNAERESVGHVALSLYNAMPNTNAVLNAVSICDATNMCIERVCANMRVSAENTSETEYICSEYIFVNRGAK